MYAIVETGGKQYRISPGQRIKVERMNAEVGSTVELDRVLAVSSENGLEIGAPHVTGARAVARVVDQGRSKKVIVFKYKPKVNYRVKRGHRQAYTELLIEAIQT
ncbi:MAG: 50S ribosomal protein L21 [bacterium]|nr:50S ribosomal protein L21 [bacterium]